MTETYFTERASGKFEPRALFIDSDRDSVDSIRYGSYSDLFAHDFLIGGNKDASNCYGTGFYRNGKLLEDTMNDSVRKVVEECNKFQGFLFTHSISCGTGSGLTDFLSQRLACNYPKSGKVSFTLGPSPSISATTVEPYNAILATHNMVEYFDTTVMLDN